MIKIKKTGLFFVYIIVSILTITLLTSCSKATPKLYEDERFLMGTIVTTKIYGNNAEKASKLALERVSDIEKLMTINQEGSEVDLVNQNAGISKIEIGLETYEVMKKALEVSKITNGAFDITMGPLVKLWGIGTQKERVPSQSEIDALLPLVNYKSVELTNSGGKLYAFLKQSGQIADLGGIAKGYAGDEMIKVLKENGIKSALVNLGGNVVVMGLKPDGTKWSLGVQKPMPGVARGNHIGIIKVTDKAVVTSGNYERYFEQNGRLYHHILDNKTGYPTNSGLESVTLVTDTSIDADALNTGIFSLGLEEGLKVVNSIGGIDAIFVTNDKRVVFTKGLKDSFEATDSEYKYEQR